VKTFHWLSLIDVKLTELIQSTSTTSKAPALVVEPNDVALLAAAELVEFP